MRKLLQTSILLLVLATTSVAQLWNSGFSKQYDANGKEIIEKVFTNIDEFLSTTELNWVAGSFYTDSMSGIEKAECEFLVSEALIKDNPGSSKLEDLIKYAQKLINKNKKSLPVVSLKAIYKKNGEKNATVQFTYKNDGTIYFVKENKYGNTLNLSKTSHLKIVCKSEDPLSIMGLIADKKGSGTWRDKRYAYKGTLPADLSKELLNNRKKGDWESMKKLFLIDLKYY